MVFRGKQFVWNQKICVTRICVGCVQIAGVIDTVWWYFQLAMRWCSSHLACVPSSTSTINSQDDDKHWETDWSTWHNRIPRPNPVYASWGNLKTIFQWDVRNDCHSARWTQWNWGCVYAILAQRVKKVQTVKRSRNTRSYRSDCNESRCSGEKGRKIHMLAPIHTPDTSSTQK